MTSLPYHTGNPSADNKIDFILHLADNALILGHRNSEWCGHGPVLEQDIAITNISLDLLGQARHFYQYAADIINNHLKNNATEDTLAYLREERDFKNFLICELPKGNWASTTLRQFFVSGFQFYYYQSLLKSSDEQLAAIAEKSLKEVRYHLKWSSEWVIRLGDGTEESKSKMVKALDELWPFTGEFFLPADYEIKLFQSETSVDVNLIKNKWIQKVEEVFDEAGLEIPESNWFQQGGKTGLHTEYLGYILAEMQYLQRVYPGAEW